MFIERTNFARNQGVTKMLLNTDITISPPKKNAPYVRAPFNVRLQHNCCQFVGTNGIFCSIPYSLTLAELKIAIKLNKKIPLSKQYSVFTIKHFTIIRVI